MVMMAASISSGSVDSVLWNALAVHWKLPCSRHADLAEGIVDESVGSLREHFAAAS